jgi:hypothetical protein
MNNESKQHIKRILSGKGGAGSWHKQHASRQTSKPLYTAEQWAQRRADRAAKKEQIDFDGDAFNAIKARQSLHDFVDQFTSFSHRYRASVAYKRAAAILRETLPHLFN